MKFIKNTERPKNNELFAWLKPNNWDDYSIK